MARPRSRRSFRWILGVGVLIFVLLFLLPGYLVELSWMQELGYEAVFWKILGTRVLLFVVSFVVIAAYLSANVYYLIKQIPPLWASRWASEGQAPVIGQTRLTRGHLRTAGFAFAAFIALIFAGSFAARWEAFLRFAGDQAYGTADPVFENDVAFYLLQLPFIEDLQGALVALAILTLLILGTVYVLMGEVDARGGRLRVRPSVVRHLGLNLVVLLVGWGWGFVLSRYELLQSPMGAVYGAGYTDLNVRLPAYWVMIVATVLLIGLVLYTLYRYRFRLLAYGAVAYAALFIIGLLVLPALVDQVYVEPSELRRERPFIKNNIELTREAYRLDQVDERSYAAQTNLTAEQVADNQETIRNIRLWDPRLLLDTYSQLQEIRTYYQFYDVDIDRYRLDGRYRQVMLSGRELVQRLSGSADTWVNRHLQYTHGYGAVANLVAQQGEGSTPELLLKNLPPETDFPELRVDEPALYYGEQTSTYRVVTTGAEELDYPKGDDNVYVTYDGTGGVQLGSFFKQLLYAWTFSDYNILLSGYLNEESRIQYWNRVQQRIRHIAPFLKLDRDPYLVLSGNRQYWIQDAYTTSERFPYSEPAREGVFRGRNYIRNSVKIVVDAYNGDVTFYVMDEDDPVLGAYREAFPGLFKPLSAVSEDLKAHLRYPQDLFEVQAGKYNRYHMRVPRVFYNNEDLWTRPEEQYQGRSILLEPYYILTRLPDEERLEFMLMTPFTPQNRDNMIGWMAARSDFPDYGELVVYELPKERLIYGPNQVEARIDQDTEISEQLTLWDQSGSNVVRGNLIVVPIEESFLYVEPVFLTAEDLQIPQLQRVIVAYGNYVAMERTLDQALTSVLGTQLASLEDGERVVAPTGQPPAPPAAGGPPSGQPPARRGPSPELENARQALERAQEALQQGDFATFGEAFEALQNALEEEDTSSPEPPSSPDTSAAE